MRAITSFSDEGYQIYGKDFLESWARYVSIPLTVYCEGTAYNGVECRNLWEVPGCVEFVAAANGTEDYRFNAKKFARKAYAQMDALSEGGIVCWFDADIEFTAPLDETFIEAKRGPYLSYMAREHFYPCSSFVCWDTDHQDHPKFMAVYKELYDGRKLYREKEWHDAFILDVAVKKSGVNVTNLCKDFPQAARSFNVFDLVFPMGHHKKGPRKVGQKGG